MLYILIQLPGCCIGMCLERVTWSMLHVILCSEWIVPFCRIQYESCSFLKCHRKLFKIPSWELNGKFSHYWEKPGTRNSFFGIMLGSRCLPASYKWVFIGKYTVLSLVSQFWQNTVNFYPCYSQNWEKKGNISPSYSQTWE